MQGERFSFGPYVLDAHRGLLERAGATVTLGQRATGLLLALVRAQGQVLGKDELVRAAWPAAVVEESNLSVQVAALRRALGTMDGGGDYVLTVPRVGYRFAAGVTRLDAAGTGTVSMEPGPSILVLPLVPLGGGAGSRYLADGLTEDIIMGLSRFRWFRVLGRHASFAFHAQLASAREFAHRLEARYALEGSVRAAGGRIVINTRLVDAADEAQLWGERFDMAADDAVAIHDTIALRVAAAVEPELLKTAAADAVRNGSRATASVRERVHRGVWLFHRVTRDTHLQARELFREACRLDPAFGPAQFWLARVSAGLCAYGWSVDSQEDLREGHAAAARAIRMDERDPYAHYALAIVNVFREEFEPAMRAADRSVELAPAFALGHLVGGMARLFAGDAGAARVWLAEGLRLNRFDPQNFVWFNLLAHAQLACGMPGEALANARQATEIRPGWRAAAVTEVCSLVALGQLDRAHAAHAQWGALVDGEGDGLAPLWNAQPAWAEQVANWLRMGAES